MSTFWVLVQTLLPILFDIDAAIAKHGGHGDFQLSIDVKDKATGIAVLDRQIAEVSF